MDLLYIWHDYRYQSKILFGIILTPAYDPKGQGHRQEFMLTFSVKDFKISSFLNPCIDLLYIWHDYRYWSKILFSTIPTPAYDLEGKVTDLEFYVKVLHQSFKDLLIF